MDYAYTIGKTTISYSLSGEELLASESGGLSYALPLQGCITVKPRRVHSSWFRVGAAIFIIPLITFSAIAAKDGLHGVAGLGIWGVVHILFLLSGMFLLLRFRHPMSGIEFLSGESGICVWRDHVAAGRFDSFIAEVKQVIARG